MDISVVIPVFNEAVQLRDKLTEIISFMEKTNLLFEIIVINDGSIDNTNTILTSFPNVKVISNSKNMGKGYSIRKGLSQISSKKCYLCDIDIQIPLSKLLGFIELGQSFDVVLCKRISNSSNSNWRFTLGKMASRLINLLLKLDIEDTQCGFKLLNKNAVNIFLQTSINRWGTDFEFLYLAKEGGLKIAQLEVKPEISKKTTVKLLDYPKTLLDLLIFFFRSKF